MFENGYDLDAPSDGQSAVGVGAEMQTGESCVLYARIVQVRVLSLLE